MSVGGMRAWFAVRMGFQATWETWSLGVTLGCSKCLFMCEELGKGLRGAVGPSVVRRG